MSIAIIKSSIPNGAADYSGDFTDGGSVIIYATGSENFGSGPDYALFDDFNGGINGDPIPLTSPILGQWTVNGGASGNRPQYYTAESHSGTSCIKPAKGSSYDGVQWRPTPTLQTEFFISGWHKVASGLYWSNTTAIQTIGQRWKIHWLMNTDATYNDAGDDVVVPSNVSTDSLAMTGNSCDFHSSSAAATPKTSSYFITAHQPSNWWEWNEWNKMEFYGKVTGDGALTENEFEMTLSNSVTQIRKYSRSDVALHCGGGYNTWIVPGWIDTDPTNNPNMDNVGHLYDDVYLALGANSYARVEITDNSDHTSSVETAIQPHSSWSSSAITITCKKGGHASLSGKWVHVIHGDRTIAKSFQIP